MNTGNNSKNLKRFIKYIILSIAALAALISTGISTIYKQANVSDKLATYELTKFDYLVNGTSTDQVEEFKENSDVISDVFPVINISTTIKSQEISLLFSDYMEGFETGLLCDAIRLSGKYDENGLMLDKTAADKLGVGVGDTITYSLMGKSFSVNVAAIYRACTYKALNNGLGVLKWTAVHQSAYKTEKRYSFTFVEAKDEAACEALMASFVPMYGIDDFDTWYEENKYSDSYPKTLSQSEEDYEKSMENSYKTDYYNPAVKTNASKYQIQTKADYLEEATEQTVTVTEKISYVTYLVAFITPAIFIIFFVLFMLSERKSNEVLSADGESMKHLLRLNTLPSIISAASVVVLTALTLIIYAATRIYASNYPFIIAMFSLPTLIGTAIAYPITYSNIKSYYKRIANENTFGIPKEEAEKEEKKENKEPARIPAKDFVVSFRKIAYSFYAALIAIAGFVTVFLVMASSMTANYNNMVRFNGTDTNMVIFTTSELTNENSFENYNGKIYMLSDNDLQINADILADIEGESYVNNALGFDGGLKENECAVSKNIAISYGLSVGSTIRTRNSNIVYTVSKLIKSQSGIDNVYDHTGIIILKNSETLKNASNSVKGNSFISFVKEAGIITSLDTTRKQSILQVSSLKAESTAGLIVNIILSILMYLVFVAVSEIFVTKNNYTNFVFDALDGESICKVKQNAVVRNLVSYILTGIISLVVFAFINASYGIAFIIPSAIILLISALLVMLYTLMKMNRKLKFISIMKRIGG